MINQLWCQFVVTFCAKSERTLAGMPAPKRRELGAAAVKSSG